MRFHSDKTAEGTGAGDTRGRSSCRSKSARIYIAGRGRTHGARKTWLIFRPLRGIIQAPPKGRPRQSRTAARGLCGENIGVLWKVEPVFSFALFTAACSAGQVRGGIRQGLCRHWQGARFREAGAGAARPPWPAAQAILRYWAWSYPPSFRDAAGWRWFAGPWPVSLGLSHSLAAIFLAVNPPKSLPQSP